MNGPTPAGVDEVLARETSAGVAWYLEDRLGSVGDIVDNTGALIDHIAYSAFGSVLSESNPSNGDRFKYAGLVYDATVGLNFALYRVQDPATGRWLSQDPLGFAAGDTDLYRYVGNNAIDVNDRLGLQDVAKDPVLELLEIQELFDKGGLSTEAYRQALDEILKGQNAQAAADARRLLKALNRPLNPGGTPPGQAVIPKGAKPCPAHPGYFIVNGKHMLILNTSDPLPRSQVRPGRPTRRWKKGYGLVHR
jgi:RHS repeat-associated protein